MAHVLVHALTGSRWDPGGTESQTMLCRADGLGGPRCLRRQGEHPRFLPSLRGEMRIYRLLRNLYGARYRGCVFRVRCKNVKQ